MRSSKLTTITLMGLCLALTACSEVKPPTLPNLMQSPVQKAVELYKQGKYAEAQAEAERAVKDNRDLGFASTILAESLSAQAKYSEAEPHARQAVRSEPKVANSHAALARALYGIGTYGEAESEAHDALALPVAEVTPYSKAQAYEVLGNAQQAELKFKEAEKSFKDSLTLEPNYVPALVGYGSLLNTLGRPADAEQILLQAVQSDPSSVKAVSTLVACLVLQNKLDEAVKYSEKWSTLAPKDADVVVTQAKIHLSQGKLAEAETEARQAIQMNSSSGQAHTILTQALAGQGKLVEAEAMGNRATQLSPADPIAYLSLAKVLAQEKKWIESGTAMSTASNLAPLNKAVQEEVKKLGAEMMANVPHPPLQQVSDYRSIVEGKR